MAAGWTVNATQALIAIWGEQNIQENLDGVSRNKKNLRENSRSNEREGI